VSQSGHGIVLLGGDKAIQSRARRLKLPVTIGRLGPLPYAKVLFVEPGTKVPWDLLPAAWHFLERWDAAVPLWRYGANADKLGGKGERARTREVVRDLRVLTHAVELLFIRDNDDGRALIRAYRDEAAAKGDKRLAFLRAYYQTKPRLCILPRTWLAEIAQRAKRDARSQVGSPRKTSKLVRFEIAPGQFVQVHDGDQDKAREHFQRMAKRGRGRKTNVKR